MPFASSTEWMVTMLGWLSAAMSSAALEALPQLRRLDLQRLEGDVTLEPEVARPIHLSDPSGADELEDLVLAESFSGMKWHFRGL